MSAPADSRPIRDDDLPELARDQRGRPFEPHPEAAAWMPERVTAGRPAGVRLDGRQVLIALYATRAAFIAAIGFLTGLFRLKQVNAAGVVLDAPPAYVEVHPRTLGCDAQQYSLEEAYQLCERIMRANHERDRSFARMAEGLMDSHVQLQQGAVRLIETTNSTIEVARHIKAERAPPAIDIEAIARPLARALRKRERERESRWFAQLVNGPLANALTRFAERLGGEAQTAQNEPKDAKSGDLQETNKDTEK